MALAMDESGDLASLLKNSRERAKQFRELPPASQKLLKELLAIVKCEDKALWDPPRDSARAEKILASGAQGIDANVRLESGETLLNAAVRYDFGAPPRMLKVLLAAGANPNEKNDMDGCRPIDSEWLNDFDPHVATKRALLTAASAAPADGAAVAVSEGDGTALDLSCRADVDNEMLIAIGRDRTELKSLTLEYCDKVGEDGVRALVGCQALEELSLKDNDRITDQTIRCALAPSSIP